MENSFFLKFKDTKKKNGFTLLELLIAMVIFSIIAIAFISLFLSAIKQQRMILAINNVLNNTSYTLEYMDRAIRMARKDTSINGECTGVANYKYNYGTSSLQTVIRFLNFDNKCTEFYLENNKIMVRKSSDSRSANFGTAEQLTASNVRISGFRFYIFGDGQQDKKQPKITLSFFAVPVGFSIMSGIQTTITQRNPDIPQ